MNLQKANFLVLRIAEIYVKTHSTDEKGRILITPDCVSMTELEGEIEGLKVELEMIRKKGKREVGKQNKGI